MKERAASPDDLRRRVAGWRAAEQREQSIRATEPSPLPAESLRHALELCSLAGPALEQADAIREREVREARAAWRQLRERLGWRPNAREQR